VNGQFPEVGDWVTVGYGEDGCAFGTVTRVLSLGLLLDVRSTGFGPIPKNDPRRSLLLPWAQVTFVQGCAPGDDDD